MPLRDHFHPPVTNKHRWDEIHGGWPMAIVQYLFGVLPEGYVSAPNVHLGSYFEVDVAAYEEDDAPDFEFDSSGRGGTATALWAPPKPALSRNAEIADASEYEVFVYDETCGRKMVAAIEIVSPSNKDRSENRDALTAKCVSYLNQKVCVVVVDLVTVRPFDFSGPILEQFGHDESLYGEESQMISATTYRIRKAGRRNKIECWPYLLKIGNPLPTLPLWIDSDRSVPLDLEVSYEETCRVMRIK